MKTYHRHKLVEVALIKEVSPANDEGDVYISISDGTEDVAKIRIPAVKGLRGPSPGDYFVIQDGLCAVVPKKTFEEGYALVPGALAAG